MPLLNSHPEILYRLPLPCPTLHLSYLNHCKPPSAGPQHEVISPNAELTLPPCCLPPYLLASERGTLEPGAFHTDMGTVSSHSPPHSSPLSVSSHSGQHPCSKGACDSELPIFASPLCPFFSPKPGSSPGCALILGGSCPPLPIGLDLFHHGPRTGLCCVFLTIPRPRRAPSTRFMPCHTLVNSYLLRLFLRSGRVWGSQKS